jgi:hypothetical protein
VAGALSCSAAPGSFSFQHCRTFPGLKDSCYSITEYAWEHMCFIFGTSWEHMSIIPHADYRPKGDLHSAKADEACYARPRGYKRAIFDTGNSAFLVYRCSGLPSAV